MRKKRRKKRREKRRKNRRNKRRKKRRKKRKKKRRKERRKKRRKKRGYYTTTPLRYYVSAQAVGYAVRRSAVDPSFLVHKNAFL